MAAERLAAGHGMQAEGEGMICGYASLFGVTDLGRDQVEPGAFAASLKQRGTRNIRMLYQHDPAQPIGRWLELREDRRGLFVRGCLALGVRRAREVLELARFGALDGLSIGFRTIRSRPDARAGLRRILEADLWEISIVTFPMLPGARLEAMGEPGLPARMRRAAQRIKEETMIHALPKSSRRA